jgi:hypothetical protein
MCDRAFRDCVAELGMTAGFSSAAECRAFMSAMCAAEDFSAEGYDASCAHACLDVAQRGACAVFTGAEDPPACTMALVPIAPPPPPPPPPPPTCVATIGFGTFTDTITTSDPLYHSTHSKTYCLTLAASQTVRLETLPPAYGTGIDDTVVYLVGPTGAELAYNDDGGTGLYSLLTTTVTTTGSYRVVVTGWTSYDVGSYQLSVQY